jgi:hypothetical protein
MKKHDKVAKFLRSQQIPSLLDHPNFKTSFSGPSDRPNYNKKSIVIKYFYGLNTGEMALDAEIAKDLLADKFPECKVKIGESNFAGFYIGIVIPR